MFKIIVDIESFKFDPKGTSTGVVFLEIDNKFFPDSVWSDFPDVILGWWLEGFIQLLSFNEQGYYELLFMDGPCKWVIDYDGSQDVKINCYRYDKIEVSTREKIDKILESLLSVVNDFLRFCHENDYENDDLTILKRHFKKLHFLKKQFK